jgi:hypothetical protein
MVWGNYMTGHLEIYNKFFQVNDMRAKLETDNCYIETTR